MSSQRDTFHSLERLPCRSLVGSQCSMLCMPAGGSFTEEYPSRRASGHASLLVASQDLLTAADLMRSSMLLRWFVTMTTTSLISNGEVCSANQKDELVSSARSTYWCDKSHSRASRISTSLLAIARGAQHANCTFCMAVAGGLPASFFPGEIPAFLPCLLLLEDAALRGVALQEGCWPRSAICAVSAASCT